MSRIKLPKRNRYVVVCKSQRQAQILFDGILKYLESTERDMQHFRIRKSEMIIADPLDSIRFIPERQMWDTVNSCEPVKCTLISSKVVDKWLDLNLLK